jgi:hypothetical protein
MAKEVETLIGCDEIAGITDGFDELIECFCTDLPW